MNEIKSITIGLPVTDINSAVKWYRSLLGDVEEINPVPDVWELCLTSSCWLQLFEVKTSDSNPSIVRFESSNIKASHKLVSELGGKPTEIESVPEVIDYFEFSDPFDNALSFYALPAE